MTPHRHARARPSARSSRYALPYRRRQRAGPARHAGDAVRLHGRVLDGAGEPVPDALLELWQADADGRSSSEPGSLRRDGFTFTGWGRAATDAPGHYSFTTVRPGPRRRRTPPPFFALTVFARGLLDRLFTRAYLPGDDALGRRPAARRRSTRTGAPRWSRRPTTHGFVFDIRLQADERGEGETVSSPHPRHARLSHGMSQPALARRRARRRPLLRRRRCSRRWSPSRRPGSTRWPAPASHRPTSPSSTSSGSWAADLLERLAPTRRRAAATPRPPSSRCCATRSRDTSADGGPRGCTAA